MLHEHYLSLADLAEIVKTRGLGSEVQIIIRALRKQDRQHARSPFLFMFLPGEIRNKIYVQAVGDKHDLYAGAIGMPALTAVSSQVREECLSILLGDKTYSIYVRNHHFIQDSGCHRHNKEHLGSNLSLGNQDHRSADMVCPHSLSLVSRELPLI